VDKTQAETDKEKQTRCDYADGKAVYAAGKLLSACMNEIQRNGWKAAYHAAYLAQQEEEYFAQPVAA